MAFYSPLEQFDTISLIPIFFWKFDISFSSIVLPLLIADIFLLLLVFFYTTSFKLVPDFWQLLLEKLYLLVFNILDQQTGSKGYIYFPFIFSVFFFILLCNLISMTPFGIALTSHIAITLYLSLSLGLSIFIIGLLTHNVKFFKLFIPECPFLLLPFLIVIEIFSYVIRCFSLAIRLSANLIAGHTLVYIISSFIVNVVSIKFWFFFILIFLIGAVLVLEIGVAFLQAYVFTILVSIYLSDSLKTPAH